MPGTAASYHSQPMSASPASVADVAEGLRGAGYLPGDATALVAYLAAKLGKPILVEGPAGVGKTQLAKALAESFGRTLVRLQCYEGLDEAKALYEWNYRKQLLRIQAEAEGTGWQEVQDDIFGAEFLLERPLMTAIASAEPGRAADRRDRQDRPGVRGDAARAALGLPDLDPRDGPHRGADDAARAADLEQHARADRGAQAPLPLPLAGLPGSSSTSSTIVRLHAPELDEHVARRLVEVIAMVRDLDLKKPPSIAESIDWARALLLLGARDIDAKTFRDTMSIIVKHRTDLDVVTERVGVKLGLPEDSLGAASAG